MIEFISIVITIALFCYFLSYINKKDRQEKKLEDIVNASKRVSNVRSWHPSAHNRDSYTGRIVVALKWMGDDNLDLAAFILSETGKIASDSDFVYYNSKCKIEGKFPSNLDGTVFLAEEHALYMEEHTDYNCEAICIDFDRIDADKVSAIKLVSCNYDKERAFKHLDSVEVCICDDGLKEVWGEFTVNNLSKSKGNALDIGSFVYDRGKGSWIYKPKMVIQKGWWNEFINFYT